MKAAGIPVQRLMKLSQGHPNVLDYITGDGRSLTTEFVMTNNFAFGGINTSLIFKRWS